MRIIFIEKIVLILSMIVKSYISFSTRYLDLTTHVALETSSIKKMSALVCAYVDSRQGTVHRNSNKLQKKTWRKSN